MASKRFRGERYALDQRVEFRNGRYWHPAVVTGAVAIDGTGCQYYPLRAAATAGVIQEGQHLRGYPGFIRPLDDTSAPSTNHPTASQ
jgi:hypothetical protein